MEIFGLKDKDGFMGDSVINLIDPAFVSEKGKEFVLNAFGIGEGSSAESPALSESPKLTAVRANGDTFDLTVTINSVTENVIKATLSDGRVMAIYPGGEYYIFNPDGTVYLSSQLTYKGSPAGEIVPDGDCIWCVVPDENAIIKYNPSDARIPLRIGGGAATTFNRPCSITKEGDVLYVCNQGSRKIRAYNTQTNKVKDFMNFNEKIFRYIISGKRKFVWLKSGLYEVDEDRSV